MSNSTLSKTANFYYVALGCLVVGWLVRRTRQQQLDVVMRLRNAGAL